MTLTGCDTGGVRLPPSTPPSEENSSHIPLQLPLELIKNELALALVQFSDFARATSLHDTLQSSLSFDGKQLKGPTIRDGAYLSKFARQVEYIRSFLSVIKLFPTEIVAQLGWKLMRDCEKLLKAAFSQVQNVKIEDCAGSNDDKNLLAQLVQFLILPLVQVTHDCVDLNSQVILEKQLLTSETVIDGYGVNRTRDIVEDAGKYARRIFEDSAEFLVSSVALSLQKPDYLRVLAMCRKVWKFTDDISKLLPLSSSLCLQEEFQAVENAIGGNMSTIIRAENGRTFVQFWCEIISTGGQRKVPQCVKNMSESVNDIPELYTVFITYLQDPWFWKTEVGKKMTPVLIRGIRQDLSSIKAETKKRAAFVLKAITSLYSVNQPLFDPEVAEVSNITLDNLESKKYAKFWMYFFELYDILNETQVHIIQPVLQKLNIFQEHSNNEAVSIWFPILLKKMISHDNRSVVKEGLERFLLTGQYFQCQRTNAYKSLAEQFLDTAVMPLLKDHAGWVLNEPEHFFKNAVIYGQFLMQLYSHDDLPHFRSAEKILTFLTSSGKCMNSHTVFFCVTTLDELLQAMPPSDKELSADKIIKEVESFLTLLALLLSTSLTTVSKYFREQLENRCANILLKTIPYVKYFGTLKLDSPFFLKIITFLGSITAKVIAKPGSKEKVQMAIEIFNTNGGALRDQLMTASNLHAFVKANPSSTSILGVLRYLSVSSQVNEERFEEIEKTIAHLCEQMADEEILKGSVQGIYEFYASLPREKKSSSNFNIVCDRMATQIYDILGKPELISPKDFMCCVYRIELLNVMPDMFNHAPLMLLCISQEDHLKTFLVRKLLSMILMHPVDIPEKLFSLESLTDERLENVEGIDEVSKSYFKCTETNIFAELYRRKFEVCNRVIEKESELAQHLQLKILALILDNLEKCDPNGLAAGMQLAKSVLGFALCNNGNDSKITGLLDELAIVSWSLVFELRKNEAFWNVINAFVKFIVCPYFLKNGVLSQYADLIFEHGETVWGLPLVLVQQLVKVDFPNDLLEEAHKILVKAALVGAPLPKNNRITFAMWDYLRKDEERITDDPENFNSDCKSRLLAGERLRRDIFCLLSKEETRKSADTLLNSTVVYLLQRNDQESQYRNRYFGGSSTHRLKQRIFQLLLILQPYYSYETSKVALEKMMCALSTDSPQPSVRYLGEWLVILIVQRFPKLHSMFFKCLENGINIRIGFGAFFSTICLQVSKLLESPEFYDRALQCLTTLILNQHVTVRIYAQIAFQNILEKAKQLKYESVVQKYSTVLAALECALVNVSGNCSKLHENVSQDFYVNTFNCATHFCHEVIYTLLPRISCMIKDECILNPQTIRDIIVEPLPSLPEFKVETVASLQKIYSEHEKKAWHWRTVVADGRELGEEATKENVEDEMNYQKKITPWKLLSVSGELEEYNNFNTKKRCVEEEGLVVVASLLDHLPNLGGLCRTCEIFGVQKYVVNTLKVINDQHFQSLSVSAQNWVNILEVPVRDLETFLLRYSAKGYAILGIEQANESSSLTEFRFPKKSVLLLGNEKQGIPSKLLHLVDKCIEIPQVGIIRSLNVHVTGALCIWQYASQHIL
ncbi:unnamed protein product [Orchesella dallaii]|uniref:tRNA/rRNA methyltransferase SpoU type domain-containing protein n=1 Tax=Orchesella dallaii TaxID=48710 RepID=A0ABP1REH7_9HEXA